MNTQGLSKTVGKYTILYVDDDIMSLKVFTHAFEDDYRIFTASSGSQAIKILEKNKIDLILTDQQMPEMEGSELLMKIVPLYPNIIRILITGENDINTIVKVVNAVGLDKYIFKPWNKEGLRLELDKALNLRREQGGALVDYGKVAMASNGAAFSAPADPSSTINNKNLWIQQEDQVGPIDPDKVINDNINLKESLLPRQEELKLYLEDAFILYDHFKVNKNGYWFGEDNNKLLVSSFKCDTDSMQAMACSTFLSTSLIELFYKEKIVKPDHVVANISKRLKTRFHGLMNSEQGYSMDISVLVLDKSQNIVTYCGAGQHLLYFDEKGAFNLVKGSPRPLGPVTDFQHTMEVLPAYNITEMYLTPNKEPNGNHPNKVNGSEPRIKGLLEKIHSHPMSIQRETLKNHRYNGLIGMKL